MNEAIGQNAGAALTTGDSNVFIGARTGRQVTTGGYNVAIGVDALRGACPATTYNVAIGYWAGASIATAFSCVLLGYNAGTAITQGPNNTMVGDNAGKSTTVGGSNTFIGRAAFNANVTGGFNTGIGHAAGFQFTAGDSNTFIGNQAGNAQGAGVPTTGSRNTALGELAGPSVPGLSETVCIGAGATTAQSNTAVIGGPQVTQVSTAQAWAVNGVPVVKAQQPAVADATADSVVTQLNAALAALRAHGLIAS
jgi:hypothetical protein